MKDFFKNFIKRYFLTWIFLIIVFIFLQESLTYIIKFILLDIAILLIVDFIIYLVKNKNSSRIKK